MNRSEVSKIYERLVSSSLKFEDLPAKAFRFICASAKWMYQYNLIYSDSRIDNIISRISDKYLPLIKIENSNPRRVCLIDYFGLDNRGLTQQYLRGLMADEREILYILHNTKPLQASEIIEELKSYGKAKILVLQEGFNSFINTAREIIHEIKVFGPKDILLHTAPWDIVTYLAISSLKGVCIFNINLTDHAYWIGSSLIDYNIEFRGMGEVISIEKRQIPQSKELSLPYYPIISKYSSFNGFPTLPDNAIKVFCGGAEYKMLGEDSIFFKLMDEILEISSSVYVLVAGINKGSVFEQETKKMKNHERVILLGNRKDIAQVFKHIDIYLSSYPFFGGLMSQYAAYFSKPILIYKNNNTTGGGDPTEVINQTSNRVRAHIGIFNFLQYAKELINNPSFRKAEGSSAKAALINESKFNHTLIQILDNKSSDFKFEKKTPDYEYMVNYYLDIQNKYLKDSFKNLVRTLKFKSFILFPSKSIQISVNIFQLIIEKIKHTYKLKIL